MGTLYENIMALCNERGIKGGKMCTDLGISKGLLTDLKMGRRSGISAKTADKIASYFGVTVGYLLGTETEKTPIQAGEREKRINDGFFRVMQSAQEKGYSPEDIERALNFLEWARKRDQEP